ncbi:malectin domain-containing carbohydrate-binding protein [Streptomyces sp. NPDC051940]|uniref:malectin domain-containing carbohydrate-binding protein n=1 Tax=Streptomyces sp. NPDC051940 TaxID=3155675 RepID=UPI0034418444
MLRTYKGVAATDERELFGTAAQGVAEYRFDALPDGVYEVELDFAEVSGTRPGRRVFDVLAEGTRRLAGLDVARDAGGEFRALTRTFTVPVSDGRLNLEFAALVGKPLVNAVRVTHRPDLSG